MFYSSSRMADQQPFSGSPLGGSGTGGPGASGPSNGRPPVPPPPLPPSSPLPPPSAGDDPFAAFGDEGTPFGGTAGTPLGGGNPPTEPEDTTPANFQLGALLPPILKVKVPPHSLSFDETYFLRLLAGSISLTKDEKKRIVEAIPKLKQSQIDELIRIFEDEKKKFAELPKKHLEQLDKLAKKHYEDWMDLETEIQAVAKTSEDQAKAEELRKKLGL